jgi:hypothetical protein
MWAWALIWVQRGCVMHVSAAGCNQKGLQQADAPQVPATAAATHRVQELPQLVPELHCDLHRSLTRL